MTPHKLNACISLINPWCGMSYSLTVQVIFVPPPKKTPKKQTKTTTNKQTKNPQKTTTQQIDKINK